MSDETVKKIEGVLEKFTGKLKGVLIDVLDEVVDKIKVEDDKPAEAKPEDPPKATKANLRAV